MDEYVFNLKDYYNNCESPSFRLSDKVQELTLEEKTYVNSNINFQEITGFDKNEFLNSVLRLPEKYNFAKHLLLSDNIDFEVNNILDDKSSFVYLVSLLISKTEGLYSIGYLILQLYKRGYNSKECDEKFLREIYKDLPTKDAFTLWCTVRFAYILNDAKKLKKHLEMKKYYLQFFHLN